jgi:hypothetical protein
VQTIYNSVGAKRELLSRVLDHAAAGERAPLPVPQFMAEQAERETDPRQIINDIAGTRSEKAKLDRARRRYGQDLARAWHRCGKPSDIAALGALVIRHRPGRDEDNTWETRIGALLGSSGWSADAWGGPSPLHGWQPQAIASVAEATLDCAVRYELYTP